MHLGKLYIYIQLDHIAIAAKVVTPLPNAQTIQFSLVNERNTISHPECVHRFLKQGRGFRKALFTMVTIQKVTRHSCCAWHVNQVLAHICFSELGVKCDGFVPTNLHLFCLWESYSHIDPPSCGVYMIDVFFSHRFITERWKIGG